MDGYSKTLNHREILKTQANNNLLKTKRILIAEIWPQRGRVFSIQLARGCDSPLFPGQLHFCLGVAAERTKFVSWSCSYIHSRVISDSKKYIFRVVQGPSISHDVYSWFECHSGWRIHRSSNTSFATSIPGCAENTKRKGEIRWFQRRWWTKLGAQLVWVAFVERCILLSYFCKKLAEIFEKT